MSRGRPIRFHSMSYKQRAERRLVRALLFCVGLVVTLLYLALVFATK